jgi:uncharacterized repeat protein (TIGR01451 family)
MKRAYGIRGASVLGLAMVGGVALAWAQYNPAKKLANPDPPLVIAPNKNGPNQMGLNKNPNTEVARFPLASAETHPPAAPEILNKTRVIILGTASGRDFDPVEQHPAAQPPLEQPAKPSEGMKPAISMEWIGPSQARIGRPVDYTLAVRNVCKMPLQNIGVRVQVPAEMTVTATEPKHQGEGNMLTWDLGNLASKQEGQLHLRLVGNSKGKPACRAWVTFTDTSAKTIEVTEPKLVIKADGPGKLMAGENADFTFTVTNPGDGPAEQVKIHAVLSDGLEHPRGKTVDFEIGNLVAGEARKVHLICGTKAVGEQLCEVYAEAEDDLKSSDRANLTVVMPRLNLEVIGPKLRYLDRKAVYSLQVTNPGGASATNVVVNDIIPAGFKFAAASDGGRHDFATHTVSWFLGEIGPAQTKEVKLEVVAITPGEYRHQVTAQGARSLQDAKDFLTRVEGLSAILVEVVDTDGSIEVGAVTAYEVHLTNTGSKTETDLKLVCVIPEQMQFQEAKGPRASQQANNIIFEALPTLAPRSTAKYRITVKAVAPGDVRFKALLTSATQKEPVVEMKSTRIYDDGLQETVKNKE